MSVQISNKRYLYFLLEQIPDGIMIRMQYRLSLGRWPNLKNPQRFTEKMEWYKLNYRVPLMTQCADKYRVRFYLEDKGYGQYLPQLYQVCDGIEQVNFTTLPSQFAIKCNNGSGTNIFVRDKSNIDVESIIQEGRTWNKVNTIVFGREWAYKNIEPKIVVEELLVSDDETQKNDLNDYKVMCFNGKARVVWVDIDRHIAHKRNFYDLDWNRLNVTSDCPTTEKEIHKPFGFEKMIEIAESIASDFPFVRVDFYSLNNKIYIGELTFYPWSGCVQYTPDSFDFSLGNYFELPKK